MLVRAPPAGWRTMGARPTSPRGRWDNLRALAGAVLPSRKLLAREEAQAERARVASPPLPRQPARGSLRAPHPQGRRHRLLPSALYAGEQRHRTPSPRGPAARSS